ncbi:MAG: hypothetical protein H0T56_10625 [Pseudaminobacter sp.]|nr:hypothetical protein [Pseudaminobacter sp.]
MRTLSTIGMVTILASVCGCATEDTVRLDGLTSGAGNAMAANTAMQMVDPWPAGVDRTRLLVPANRDARPDTADEAADEKTSSTTSGN